MREKKVHKVVPMHPQATGTGVTGKGQRLVVHCQNKDYYLHYDDIVSLEASGSQCCIYTRPGSIHENAVVVSKPLGHIEPLLPAEYFLRVQKSWVVNMRHVRAHLKGEIHTLLMVNKQQVPVSDYTLKEVLAALEQCQFPPFGL